MNDLAIVLIILIIVGTAVVYMVREKNKGTVCIGCPHAGDCGSKKKKNSGCECQ